MPSKNPGPAIEDMLQAIERIQDTLSGHTLKSYSADYKINYVVERAFEIISEASRKLPASLTRTQPHIPWKDIHGIGNILRHDYQKIQHRILWQTAQEELPGLKEAMLAIKTVYQRDQSKIGAAVVKVASKKRKKVR